jgi:hypothetical protein
MPKFVHDLRIGAGYGFTGRKGFQSSLTPSGASFPYNDADEFESEEHAEETDQMKNLHARINQKIGYGNLARPPEDRRTDRFTLAKNRLNLAEGESNARTLIGLVPFPLKRFDGPVIGGASTNPSYTTAPGRIDGSPYGWTKGILSPLIPAQDAPPRFMDAIDPEFREKVKGKLKISRIK